jgi:hypothetical protein
MYCASDSTKYLKVKLRQMQIKNLIFITALFLTAMGLNGFVSSAYAQGKLSPSDVELIQAKALRYQLTRFVRLVKPTAELVCVSVGADRLDPSASQLSALTDRYPQPTPRSACPSICKEKNARSPNEASPTECFSISAGNVDVIEQDNALLVTSGAYGNDWESIYFTFQKRADDWVLYSMRVSKPLLRISDRTPPLLTIQ